MFRNKTTNSDLSWRSRQIFNNISRITSKLKTSSADGILAADGLLGHTQTILNLVKIAWKINVTLFGVSASQTVEHMQEARRDTFKKQKCWPKRVLQGILGFAIVTKHNKAMMYIAEEAEDTEAAHQAVIQRHPTKRNESSTQQYKWLKARNLTFQDPTSCTKNSEVWQYILLMVTRTYSRLESLANTWKVRQITSHENYCKWRLKLDKNYYNWRLKIDKS
jgi:hypothetical protein